MSTTEQELASFANFVRHIISSGGFEASIDELFDQWRSENPSDAQYAEDLAAVRTSIEDFKGGERGTLAGEHSAQLRGNLGAASS